MEKNDYKYLIQKYVDILETQLNKLNDKNCDTFLPKDKACCEARYDMLRTSYINLKSLFDNNSNDHGIKFKEDI